MSHRIFMFVPNTPLLPAPHCVNERCAADGSA
jgi:hypothetical protein